MTTAALRRLPVRRGANGSDGARPDPVRREADGVGSRVVEYCPYPRTLPGQGWRVGFTRELSAAGAVLEVAAELRLDALLRVVLRDIDGRPALDLLARVAWCRPSEGGTVLAGLELLGQRAERAGIRRVPPLTLVRSA